jgi:hypothetical protein
MAKKKGKNKSKKDKINSIKKSIRNALVFIWKNHSSIKSCTEFIAAIAGIIAFIYAISYISSVNVIPNSLLGLCPHIEADGCFVDNVNTCRSDVNVFNNMCREGDKLILSSTVYNKGLALSMGVVLNISMKNVSFNLTEDGYLQEFIIISLNDGKRTIESKFTKCEKKYNENICYLEASIDILKPNDMTVISFTIPKVDILKYPDSVTFALEDNGKPASEKSINLVIVRDYIPS